MLRTPPTIQPLLTWLDEEKASAFSFTKGAVDGLLEVFSTVWLQDTVQPLSDGLRAHIRETNEQLASKGIRPVMITGDHPIIARYIADELGLGHYRACYHSDT